MNQQTLKNCLTAWQKSKQSSCPPAGKMPFGPRNVNKVPCLTSYPAQQSDNGIADPHHTQPEQHR